MPNFDSGKYFLTVLLPIKTDPVEDAVDGGETPASSVAAVREALSLLPTAQQSPSTENAKVLSPFAVSQNAHFVRMFILDDLVFNGRTGEDAIALNIRGTDPTVPRTVDKLGCPYLVISAEFDAESGDDKDLKDHLDIYWNSPDARDQICSFFRHCQGFDRVIASMPQGVKASGQKFFEYMKACQIETTMPFTDYRIDASGLPSPWLSMGQAASIVGLGILAALSLVVAYFSIFTLLPSGLLNNWAFIIGPVLAIAGVLGFMGWFKLHNGPFGKIAGPLLVAFGAALVWQAFFPAQFQLDALQKIQSAWPNPPSAVVGFWGLLAGLVAAAVFAAVALWILNNIGSRGFPGTAYDSLPHILKALYLQQRFSEFVIDNQGCSKQQLFDEFGRFLKNHRPDDLDRPTQRPAVIRTKYPASVNTGGAP